MANRKAVAIPNADIATMRGIDLGRTAIEAGADCEAVSEAAGRLVPLFTQSSISPTRA
jgi:hypothetical protein